MLTPPPTSARAHSGPGQQRFDQRINSSLSAFLLRPREEIYGTGSRPPLSIPSFKRRPPVAARAPTRYSTRESVDHWTEDSDSSTADGSPGPYPFDLDTESQQGSTDEEYAIPRGGKSSTASGKNPRKTPRTAAKRKSSTRPATKATIRKRKLQPESDTEEPTSKMRKTSPMVKAEDDSSAPLPKQPHSEIIEIFSDDDVPLMRPPGHNKPVEGVMSKDHSMRPHSRKRLSKDATTIGKIQDNEALPAPTINNTTANWSLASLNEKPMNGDADTNRETDNQHRHCVEQLEKQKKRNQELEEELAEIKVQNAIDCENLRREHAAERSRLAEEKEKLQSDLDAACTTADELPRLAEEREGLQLDLDAARTTIDELQTAVDTKDQELGKLQVRIYEEKEQHAKLIAATTAAHNELLDKIVALELTVSELEAANASLKKEATEANPSRNPLPSPAPYPLSPAASSPIPPARSSSVALEEHVKTENVRKAFMDIRRRYDRMYTPVKNLVGATRGWEFSSFGEFGTCIRQLMRVVDEIRTESSIAENGSKGQPGSSVSPRKDWIAEKFGA